MPVTLQITSGPSTGKRIHVARGQIAKVGRTEWADFSFPNDTAMADIHFAIHADGPECLIRDASGGIGTLINGAPVSESRIHTGDTVTAGATTFSVIVEGELAPVDTLGGASSVAVVNKTPVPGNPPVPSEASDFCRSLKMSDGAKQLLQEGMAPPDFLDLLIKQEQYSDALRFLAFWLPKPVAVGWGCDCVADACAGNLTLADQNALAAARAWAKEPNETNRRAAEAAANETQFSGPASWMALGAFWSGGSLAGPDLPEVPPGEALTAEALTGALMLAATQTKPTQATARYRTFLDAGRNVIPK